MRPFVRFRRQERPANGFIWRWLDELWIVERYNLTIKEVENGLNGRL